MQVLFYASSSGRRHIDEYLSQLDQDSRADIVTVFKDIEKKGFSAIGCEFRQIEGKLWEIKIRTSSGGYRFFYVVLPGGTMKVLHAYRKQGKKAPARDIEVARKRMKEVLR